MDTTRNAETPPDFVPKNAPFATPKHHATEGRNDLQINRKNKFPGGRNVPSEILLEILSYPISYPISCYRLMDTTRNAETPPNFVPKTLQKWPGKVPYILSYPISCYRARILSYPAILLEIYPTRSC